MLARELIMDHRRILDRTAGGTPGFSLVETLVALAVVAVAVVMLAAIVGHEPRALRRIEAHREAYSVLERAIESVRAGSLPVAGLDGLDPTPWLPPRPAAKDLRLEAVTSQYPGRSGLTRIHLTVHYEATGGSFARSLETLHWRPPP